MSVWPQRSCQETDWACEPKLDVANWNLYGMQKQIPRQCRKCRNWFYDLPGYGEGKYACRWHRCDLLDHLARELAGRRRYPDRSIRSRAILGLMVSGVLTLALSGDWPVTRIEKPHRLVAAHFDPTDTLSVNWLYPRILPRGGRARRFLHYGTVESHR